MGLSQWFKDSATNIGAFFGHDASQQYVSIRDAESPSTEILRILGEQPGMDTPENRARIQTIAGDQRFTAALDSAIKSDNSIITRLADNMAATGENGAPQDPSRLLEQLADGTKRGVMTQFLAKIGESDSDKFDGTYLDRVMVDANKNNLIGLNRTAQEMGIQNTALSMGAMAQGAGINMDGSESPMEMISGFLANPRQGIASWLNNPNGPFVGLDDDSKGFIASFVEIIAKFANVYQYGNGITDPYIDFAKKYGGAMIENGKEILNAGNPATPQGTATAGLTDGNNITVAQDIRPARGGAFMSAALGGDRPALEPNAVTPDATRPEVARVERQLQGQSVGGMTFAT